MTKTSLYLVTAALLITLSACVGTGEPRARYTLINASEAWALHQRKVLFIDVRTKGSYDDGHIPDAVNLSWGRNFSQRQLAKVADKQQELVIYCYGIACEISAKATSLALAWGYSRVYYFQKGFPGWWNAGYPIQK